MAKTLEKIVKNAIADNKYKCGTKEVIHSMRGSKLIVMSNSVAPKDRLKLEEEAKTSNIPIYWFQGNSVQLGKLCNKPFRISIMSLKSGSDDDIDSLISNDSKSINE
ncbi:MAG: ribosomal L7Ae/L30e/S12e/Gadd45 family protein [Thermoproteota archaeon]|nr:ribosomal L7Ae/L30e/S12e/Gadd45 family protein [Thermoproteota archaeon]